MNFCGLYCLNVTVFLFFFQFEGGGSPGAENIHYFV